MFVVGWTWTKLYYTDNIQNVIEGDNLGQKTLKTFEQRKANKKWTQLLTKKQIEPEI